MKKQEFIKQEWLKFIGIQIYDSLKVFNELNDEGWRKIKELPHDFEKNYDYLITDIVDFLEKNYVIRPKSLSRIENNNGWIKVDSIDILPNHNIECWFITQGEVFCGYYNSDFRNFNFSSVLFSVKEVSYYQPIRKPLNPIY